MIDVRELLERQTEWQKGRVSLPWPEKVRIAERIRASIVQLQRMRLAAGSGPKANR